MPVTTACGDITRTLRGRVAVVGIGETTYYKHGQAPEPEFKLALRAILAACADAGIDPREVDGFASYANERNDAVRLATALGVHELRWATMQWGGGGGGGAAAVASGAAAINAGLADCVVVHRALAQGEFGRFGQSVGQNALGGEMAWQTPYGVIAPPQKFALRVQRFLQEHGIRPEAQRAIALACYHHAQANPRAVMHGKPLDEARYDSARWIVEPFRLFDCCMENDGAAALVLMSADRARHARRPVWLLGAAAGGAYRAGAQPHNAPDYASANQRGTAQALYRMAGVGPADVGSVQCYENFTGAVAMALVEHGFFSPAEANDFLQLPHLIAPDGRLPLNTSGGHLAECYMHGLGLMLEAVRQVRGESTSPARRRDVALVISAPLVTPTSSLLLGSENVL